jgi:hypothetical protein
MFLNQDGSGVVGGYQDGSPVEVAGNFEQRRDGVNGRGAAYIPMENTAAVTGAQRRSPLAVFHSMDSHAEGA